VDVQMDSTVRSRGVRVVLAAFAIVLALALVACGSDDEGGSTGSGSS
jgi:hypothetical protein